MPYLIASLLVSRLPGLLVAHCHGQSGYKGCPSLMNGETTSPCRRQQTAIRLISMCSVLLVSSFVCIQTNLIYQLIGQSGWDIYQKFIMFHWSYMVSKINSFSSSRICFYVQQLIPLYDWIFDAMLQQPSFNILQFRMFIFYIKLNYLS